MVLSGSGLVDLLRWDVVVLLVCFSSLLWFLLVGSFVVVRRRRVVGFVGSQVVNMAFQRACQA
jgi:hypothetical protein